MNVARIRLGMLLASFVMLSMFVDAYLVVKTTTFAIGMGFFGQPLITRGVVLLNEKYPEWPKLLDIRKYVAQSLIGGTV